MIDNALNFLELYKLEWQAKIANIYKKTLDDNKFEKALLLPLTDDLLKIRVFLKNSIPNLTKKLLESSDLVTWQPLAIGLTVFNRRRGNEVFQLLIIRFVDSAKWKDSEMDETKRSLTALEQRLMGRYLFLFVNK